MNTILFQRSVNAGMIGRNGPSTNLRNAKMYETDVVNRVLVTHTAIGDRISCRMRSSDQIRESEFNPLRMSSEGP